MHIAANMEGMGLYLAWPTLSKAGPKQTPGHIPGWAGHVVLRHPYGFFCQRDKYVYCESQVFVFKDGRGFLSFNLSMDGGMEEGCDMSLFFVWRPGNAGEFL